MATCTPEIQQVPTLSVEQRLGKGRMKFNGTDPNFGDWRDDLIRDGYAAIKCAIPLGRVNTYAERMDELLEYFVPCIVYRRWHGGLGHQPEDPSTVHPDTLPVMNAKGMLFTYAAPHEDFVWSIRSEPGIIDAFAKVYQDENLIVSFDAIQYGLANRTHLPENKPWPHQDQDPEKPGFECLQGLVHLHRAGPDDGGLIVCQGGHRSSAQFHEEMKNEERIPAWTPDWYGHTDGGMKWLADDGNAWHKVCADAGDLIVWDSRVPHYHVSTKSDVDRLAV